MSSDYLEINRKSWNDRTKVHVDSSFYDNESFIKGADSLKEIESAILGDVRGKRILHLQCHFGQDSISLARRGAHVTGVDLSDVAIDEAKKLAEKCRVDIDFICSDVLELVNTDIGQFDLIFTTYGVIGWHPDMERWANVINHCLVPGGKLILVEFHPVVWMFNDDFDEVAYRYFNEANPIIEEGGTYADDEGSLKTKSVFWNHGLSEVMGPLLKRGLNVNDFQEYDYSPYSCFNDCVSISEGRFRIRKMDDKLPMVYSLLIEKAGI